MYKKTDNELTNALRQMLSKNSTLFSAEEVNDTEEVISRLENLQTSTKIGISERENDLKKEYDRALIEMAVVILKLFLDPEILKMLNHLLH